MEIIKKNYKSFILIILYTVGITGIAVGSTRDFFLSLSPIHLTVTLFLSTPLTRKYSSPIYLIIVGLVGYAAEVVGTNTGIIFGDYSYLNNLGPKFLNVPVLLVALWITSVYGAFSIVQLITKKTWLSSFISACLCTGLDILIEPLCKDLGYWKWHDHVGIENFAAWFVISFVLSQLLSINRILPQREAVVNFILQIIFFLLLNFSFYGKLQY